MDQAVKDFEHALDSIIMDSTDTTELEVIFDEDDARPSSVSSIFLHPFSTVSDTSRPELAPSIKSNKLWCQAGDLLLPVLQACKMSASKLICYLSSHQAAFGF